MLCYAVPSLSPPRTLPLCESSREDVLDTINTFVAPPTNRHGSGPPAHCLIISYETFRLHAARLAVPGACDLLICDEVCAGWGVGLAVVLF
jgi:DNA repair and recombination RAD54-like protein